MNTEQVTRLLAGMDVPEQRRNVSIASNVRWLLSNLGIRNSSNPNYSRTMELLKNLRREQEKPKSEE